MHFFYFHHFPYHEHIISILKFGMKDLSFVIYMVLGLMTVMVAFLFVLPPLQYYFSFWAGFWS